MATIWRTENFSRGLHTKPARAGGGENYAADIENLQVDGDGFLRLRPNFRTVGPGGADITGIAASEKYLLVLRNNALLYLRELDNLDEETAISMSYFGTENLLSGRISIVSTFRDYIVITSEGSDQGFWIDLREGRTLRAYSLGLDPPEVIFSKTNPPISAPYFTLRSEYNGEDAARGNFTYLYKITYVRRIEAGLGEVVADALFNGMESVSSEPVRIDTDYPLGYKDDEGVLFVIHVENLLDSADNQATGIYLYRTEDVGDHLEALDDDAVLDLDNFPYRRIGYLPRRIGSFKDFGEYPNPDSDANKNLTWKDGELYVNENNKRLPGEVKQIHYHQGRIFAPAGDRLIYSDFRGTVQAIWAFPATNEIRRTRPGRVDFCASHREVLLFGGHDGLYRLTGLDSSDFDSDEISGVGPLDGYSWGTFKNSLGFVGSYGLYLTDASSVQFLSEAALDGFFDAKIVQRGAVLFFEDDTMLFFVRLQSLDDEGITDSFFLFDDRHWVRWVGETATQFASNASRFYVAGDANFKQIQWRMGENTNTNLPWAWESNLIHGQEQGAGNLTKRFAELLLSAAAGTDITLKTWLDTQEEPTERQFETRDDLYFQRIPIERIGKRLRFRLEGTGPVTIRGLQIEGEV
ncbi:hypothetical protein J4G02_20360 [Candidatus Poribacteria bacterium]|nr:hypothetical protein [Candidatus Poribacteria bacterium]